MSSRPSTMKALVFDGPGKRSWTDWPLPKLTATTDAMVRIDTVTICGTDLHILSGEVPTVDKERVLGHEAVGMVAETGSAVTGVQPFSPATAS